MRQNAIFAILFCALILPACTRSAGINATLPSQVPTGAVSPTPAPVTLTFTPEPTATFAPTTVPKTSTPAPGDPPPTPTTALPGEVPLAAWREIPVMPGAITGEELPDRYRFLVTAKADDVRNFYKSELPKLGYAFSADGTGENGAPISIFTKNGSYLSISMIVLGDLIVVTLAPI